MHWKSRSRSRSSTFAVLAWTVIAACLALQDGVVRADASAACVLVASEDVPLEDVTFEEIRRLYLFRKQFWSPGKPVNLILVESQLAPGSCLLDRIYRMDANAFRAMVRRKIYAAEIEVAPKVVTSESDALAYATHGEGVLTLVPASAVGDAGVRVLKIDGRLPGEPGYPLER